MTRGRKPLYPFAQLSLNQHHDVNLGEDQSPKQLSAKIRLAMRQYRLRSQNPDFSIQLSLIEGGIRITRIS